MFGENSGFFSVRHICNARQNRGQAGPCEARARNSRNLAASFRFRASDGSAPLNEVLTGLKWGNRTPMQSDRNCVFSALGGGGWPSIWLICHDKGEYFHEENSSSNSRDVGSPEHRGLRSIRR